MEYKTVAFQLDVTNRPPLPLGKISTQARHEYIRKQQEWFEQATEPVRNRAREIGCTALSQLWHTGEFMVAVPQDGFDDKVESLLSAAGIAGYVMYDP